MPQIFIPKIEQLTVRNGGDCIILLDGHGKRICSLPYDAALALSKAIRIQAKRVEETQKALQVIEDQAVLMRAGFPIGLTNDNTKLNEARKEAHWNSDLRKYMPHIEPTMEVYSPSIVKHKPKGVVA